MELVQKLGTKLCNFIPVILMDKAPIAEADGLLSLDQDLQLLLCLLVGPVQLGSQYLWNREVPALLFKLQLQYLQISAQLLNMKAVNDLIVVPLML